MIKNPQENSVLECVHQVFGNILCTSELDMANSMNAESVSYFIDNTVWSVCSTYHTVQKSSPGAAFFGCDMLFDIPYLVKWNKIGEYRQAQTNLNTLSKNACRVDFDYAVGVYAMVCEDGILCKAASKYTGPFCITTVHTNGTIRIKKGALREHLNIRRVKSFFPPDTDTNVEDNSVEWV